MSSWTSSIFSPRIVSSLPDFSTWLEIWLLGIHEFEESFLLTWLSWTSHQSLNNNINLDASVNEFSRYGNSSYFVDFKLGEFFEWASVNQLEHLLCFSRGEREAPAFGSQVCWFLACSALPFSWPVLHPSNLHEHLLQLCDPITQSESPPKSPFPPTHTRTLTGSISHTGSISLIEP